MSQDIFSEAKRYHSIGLNIHWIRENSKAPVETGWAGRPRRKFSELSKRFGSKLGVGAQTGNASLFPDGRYLGMIDVDLKSKHPHHIDEALSEVNRLFGALLKDAPCVKSPNGLRYLIKTASPGPSKKLSSSKEKVKIFLPSDTRSQESARKDAIESGILTAKEWAKGYRSRKAWEIEFLSNGKQGVLPPSMHPDAGVPYEWLVPLEHHEAIPLISEKKLKKAFEKAGASDSVDEGGASSKAFVFQPTEIDLECSSAPEDLVRLIVDGEGAGPDKSADLFSAAMQLIRLGFTEADILTIFTDEAYYLGSVGYEHAQTKKRFRAARWVEKYTLRKAAGNLSPEKAFGMDEGPRETARLSPEAAEEQLKEVKASTPWRSRLKRKPPTKVQLENGVPGDPLPTLENMVLILENMAGKEIFKRDTFAIKDVYGERPPWGEHKIGDSIQDVDIAEMRHWFNVEWGFTPSKDSADAVMALLAVKNSYHPIVDRLRALPDWDEKPRLATWLTKYFGASDDEKYVGAVFRKFLVASIARVHRPGTKFDWMIVLEGPTGGGKTYFGDILFGEDVFVDGVPPLKDNKAAVEVIQGAQCAEFGELSSFSGVDINVIKSFITRRFDKVRFAYDRRPSQVGRQTVFIGTTEDDKYLKADEKNRRFMPIKVGRLNIEQLKRDRDQLWAEAFYIYEMGLEPSLYLDGGELAAVIEIRKEKVIEGPEVLMAQDIEAAFEAQKEGDIANPFNFDDFTLFDLFNEISGPLRRWGRPDANYMKASKALKIVGAVHNRSKARRYWSYSKE